MAVFYEDMPISTQNILETTNVILSFIFLFEAFLKIIAYGL